MCHLYCSHKQQRSQFIARFHCRAFICDSLAVCLIGGSLVSPVLRCCFFAGTSLGFWFVMSFSGRLLLQGISSALWNARSCPPRFYRLCFLTLFVGYFWRNSWPEQNACRNHQALSYRHRYLSLFLDRICGSDVLSNSCPYSLWMAAFTGLVVALYKIRRRDKFLVVAMTIYHPSYPIIFFTCLLVFDKSSLCTSKKIGS